MPRAIKGYYNQIKQYTLPDVQIRNANWTDEEKVGCPRKICKCWGKLDEVHIKQFVAAVTLFCTLTKQV